MYPYHEDSTAFFLNDKGDFLLDWASNKQEPVPSMRFRRWIINETECNFESKDSYITHSALPMLDEQERAHHYFVWSSLKSIDELMENEDRKIDVEDDNLLFGMTSVFEEAEIRCQHTKVVLNGFIEQKEIEDEIQSIRLEKNKLALEMGIIGDKFSDSSKQLEIQIAEQLKDIAKVVTDFEDLEKLAGASNVIVSFAQKRKDEEAYDPMGDSRIKKKK